MTNRQRIKRPSRAASYRARPMRRAQLISPFGVGAITDFRYDEALMCAGVDAWFGGKIPPNELMVFEERLQRRLSCNFFVLPPAFDENLAGSRERVPFVRFPGWHYCPACFRMRRTTLFGDQVWCDNCPRTKRRRRMIPVRFVVICENGHIEDFPFRQWIGCTSGSETECELYFKPGRSAASLAGIRIECRRCGQSNTMAGAFGDGALASKGVRCRGAQPWLGRSEGRIACEQRLQTVQRGGSNVYFPAVASSIYIPPSIANLDPVIRQILDDPVSWNLMSAVPADQLEDRIRVIAAMKKVDARALSTAVDARLDSNRAAGMPGSEEAFRAQEYEALQSDTTDPRSELFCEIRKADEYPGLYGWIEQISLVKKLRETRVLHGFSRRIPCTDIGDARLQPLSRDAARSWLPATVVHGEGIFVQFRHDKLSQWAAASNVRSRLENLTGSYLQSRARRGLAPRAIDGRFLLLHSLAHILIRELSFQSGYGSASLRERLYCNLEAGAVPMAGILIYTASGDSEGTLGGLVAQARPDKFEELFLSALRRSLWCSNDPVCIESKVRGSDQANLAACHGCLLLPETSCEEGNRLLDRALLIGQLDDAAMGFFSPLIEQVNKTRR